MFAYICAHRLDRKVQSSKFWTHLFILLMPMYNNVSQVPSMVLPGIINILYCAPAKNIEKWNWKSRPLHFISSIVPGVIQHSASQNKFKRKTLFPAPYAKVFGTYTGWKWQVYMCLFLLQVGIDGCEPGYMYLKQNEKVVQIWSDLTRLWILIRDCSSATGFQLLARCWWIGDVKLAFKSTPLSLSLLFSDQTSRLCGAFSVLKPWATRLQIQQGLHITRRRPKPGTAIIPASRTKSSRWRKITKWG